ncbi:hypothetical protein CH63R_07468 [Colletotrichum higginsianum IMI 349063]|uniref:Uncharacterized protein n=1 Tax=Colletotrichum higginsianum (strain IMI 349063) TaxID=759273 RepID=A0A1B7Y9C7_COLHI|nr:hypothetical protein CH63R_07468 [Colletotrichum higginsianum IMI 349063]OBR08703.1 hypothetical protein CH63R_07468 [Colletotrichum higginsianum IMI 349063]
MATTYNFLRGACRPLEHGSLFVGITLILCDHITTTLATYFFFIFLQRIPTHTHTHTHTHLSLVPLTLPKRPGSLRTRFMDGQIPQLAKSLPLPKNTLYPYTGSPTPCFHPCLRPSRRSPLVSVIFNPIFRCYVVRKAHPPP